MRKQPRFAVGDMVGVGVPFLKMSGEVGVVIKLYELDDQYRYVVQFENGSEEVFFERELFSIEANTSSGGAS